MNLGRKATADDVPAVLAAADKPMSTADIGYRVERDGEVKVSLPPAAWQRIVEKLSTSVTQQPPQCWFG